MTTYGPSKIQKYNNHAHQARQAEKIEDWVFAARMWRAALEIAQLAFWKDKETWSANRASFCEKMHQRSKK